MRPIRHTRSNAIAPILAAAVVIVLVLAWGLGGSHPAGDTTSPDGTYRVEFVVPNRLTRFLHRGMDDPQFVRLHDEVDGHLIGTGPVMDMAGGSNATVTWLQKETGQVSVGIDTMFWHVHPLTRTGAALPIDHELDPSMAAKPARPPKN